MIPAGTAKAAPLVTPIVFPERTVRQVSWRVPPGPSGLMGWALTSDGTPVIPVQPKTYIVTDNQADSWELEGYLDSGNWQVTGYNTGIYPHTVYLTFLLDLIGSGGQPSAPAADAGVGVVGAVGTVTGTTSTVPPPPVSAPPPDDSAAAVTTAVLALLMAQVQAPAG